MSRRIHESILVNCLKQWYFANYYYVKTCPPNTATWDDQHLSPSTSGSGSRTRCTWSSGWVSHPHTLGLQSGLNAQVCSPTCLVASVPLRLPEDTFNTDCWGVVTLGSSSPGPIHRAAYFIRVSKWEDTGRWKSLSLCNLHSEVTSSHISCTLFIRSRSPSSGQSNGREHWRAWTPKQDSLKAIRHLTQQVSINAHHHYYH